MDWRHGVPINERSGIRTGKAGYGRSSIQKQLLRTRVCSQNSESGIALNLTSLYPPSSSPSLLHLQMSLPLRTLGRGGPSVSAIGLGFGSIGGFYGPAGTLDKKVALLDHAHATGLRFWDMADIYGDSDDVVGEWIKRSGKRNDVFLATKFGFQRQPDGRHTFRSDPKYVKAACAQSLQRLGVETIDLYYCTGWTESHRLKRPWKPWWS